MQPPSGYRWGRSDAKDAGSCCSYITAIRSTLVVALVEELQRFNGSEITQCLLDVCIVGLIQSNICHGRCCRLAPLPKPNTITPLSVTSRLDSFRKREQAHLICIGKTILK